MKRRQAINKTGWILSSAIFGSGLMTALQGCATEAQIPDELQVFNADQYQLTRALSDTILPRTKSPSASDVKVPEFMDLLLNDVFQDEARTHILEGLVSFEEHCKKTTGNSFTSLAEEEKYNYLLKLDEKTMQQDYEGEIPFYFTFKKLCINIYYSTEEGIKQNLNYNPIPGGFQGDVLLQPGDIIEVGNEI